MKKILITGGAGFIGSHIADAYIKLGHRVTIVDNLSNGNIKNINPKAKFYQCDITDAKKIREIILKEQPQIVNHHAAQTKVVKSIKKPLVDIKNNIIGTINILEAIKKLDNFEKIIFASSGGAIYSTESIIPIQENSPVKPLSPYGISKYSCELYLNCYYQNFGIKYNILRYSNVYGPRQVANGEGGVIAIFCKALTNANEVKIYGDGKQTRDYIYVKDVVSANIKILNYPKNNVFNIGTEQETSVNKLFKIISQEVDNKISPNYLPIRTGEVFRSCPNVALAKKELHWVAKTNVKEGLSQTLNWFQIQK